MFRTTKFALVLFVFLAAIVTIPSESSAKENSLKKGKWALQFEVNQLIDINAFQGSTLSIKKHTSDGSAWRLGLTLHFDVRDESTEILISQNIKAPGFSDVTDVMIGIAFQRVFYPNPNGDVNLFWGLGPTYSYRYRLNDRENISRDGSYQEKRKIEEYNWSLGINGILGVEWFATKSISFLAEYGTSVTYNYRNSRNIRKSVRDGNVRYSQNSTNKLNEVRLASSQVKFGLSVYF